jgi:ribosomal-protein-alanine N-acetyltransferase
MTMEPGALARGRFGMSARPQVRLVPATVPLLQALDQDRARFGELIGSPVPDGWPEFPEAITFTLEHLRSASEADRTWSLHFFLEDATGRLLGSGGFAAPPVGRTVEIGYEVAPAFRGRGLGAVAARALVRLAVATGEVDQVVAHTLPGPNPSTGVLVALGFERVADQEDPGVGVVWEWRWSRPLVE